MDQCSYLDPTSSEFETRMLSHVCAGLGWEIQLRVIIASITGYRCESIRLRDRAMR